MRKSVKSQLDVGMRGATFAREHPDANPIITAAGTNLDGLSDQASAIEGEYQVAGFRREAAIADRKRVEDEINTALRGLLEIAAYAALRRPDVPVRFRMPGTDGGLRGFAGRVRGVIEVVNDNRELLLTYGMPETMPTQLQADLDSFERFGEARHAAQQAREALRARQAEVARQLMQGVRHLDGLYRIRHAANPDVLSAWRQTIALPVSTRKEDEAANARTA